MDDRLGGAPANVACGLARLGTAVAFLGRLGEDAIGISFRETFAARGVNTQAVQWDQSRPSRIVLVKRDANGDREVRRVWGNGYGWIGGDPTLSVGFLGSPDLLYHPTLSSAASLATWATGSRTRPWTRR